MQNEALDLTHLGKISPIENDPDKVKLDLIPKPNVNLIYCCRFSIPEFVSKCPATNQPDFAIILIDYVPYKHLIESKALKLWMFAFRNHGSFHEAVTSSIADRFYKEVKPYWLRVASFFNARGGISIDTVVELGILPMGVHPLSIDNMKPYLGRL